MMFGLGRPSHPPFPRIVVEVRPDAMRVCVELPDLSRLSMEAASGVAENLAATIHILSNGSGRALALLQGALGHSAALRGEQEFGEYAMRLINGLQVQRVGEKESGPLVVPSEAFTGNRNGE